MALAGAMSRKLAEPAEYSDSVPILLGGVIGMATAHELALRKKQELVSKREKTVTGWYLARGHGSGLHRVQHRLLYAMLHFVGRDRSNKHERTARRRRADTDADAAEDEGSTAAADCDHVATARPSWCGTGRRCVNTSGALPATCEKRHGIGSTVLRSINRTKPRGSPARHSRAQISAEWSIREAPFRSKVGKTRPEALTSFVPGTLGSSAPSFQTE